MLNKKDNRNKLSDEDILKEVDFSDNLPTPKQEVKTQSDVIVNDFVDSSLFVVDELLGNDKNENPHSAIQSKKTLNSLKPEVFQQERNKNEYFRDEILPNAEEGIITIKADKSDTENYLKWKVSAFVLILIVVGTGAYIFFVERKDKAATKPEQNIVATEPEIASVNAGGNISEGSNIDKSKEKESAEAKIDFLKMKIDVFNASGVAGAAGKTKDLLVNAKYESVEAKNYSDDMVGVTVFYGKEEYKEGAQEIVDILKKNNAQQEIKLSIAEKEIESDVAIVLGK